MAVAMEGYDGYARPLDRGIVEKDYKLYNVNNLKLDRLREIFPAPLPVIDSGDTKADMSIVLACEYYNRGESALEINNVVDFYAWQED